MPPGSLPNYPAKTVQNGYEFICTSLVQVLTLNSVPLLMLTNVRSCAQTPAWWGV